EYYRAVRDAERSLLADLSDQNKTSDISDRVKRTAAEMVDVTQVDLKGEFEYLQRRRIVSQGIFNLARRLSGTSAFLAVGSMASSYARLDVVPASNRDKFLRKLVYLNRVAPGNSALAGAVQDVVAQEFHQVLNYIDPASEANRGLDFLSERSFLQPGGRV